jgi:hypothetical protein
MFVRLDHASLQASDLSRSSLASEAALKAAPGDCGAVAAARSSHCTRSAVLGWVENNVITSALPLNGLDMNSCAVDGLVVASGVPRDQKARMSDPNVKIGPIEA